MTTAEKEAMATVLKEKRDELIRAIRGTAATMILEPVGADLIDHIQSMTGRDQMAIMLTRFSATLEDVERSLRAISDGTYGICAMCEDPISDRRLRTIPWAAHCIHCQERIETGQWNGNAGAVYSNQPHLSAASQL